VIFSTEVYFYTEYGVELIGEQYNWLEQDLKVWEQLIWFEKCYTCHIKSLYSDRTVIYKMCFTYKSNFSYSQFLNRQSPQGRTDHGLLLVPIDQCTAPLMIMMTVTRERALYETSSIIIINTLIYTDR